MIASQMSRRAVVGGLVGVAALSGCSSSDASTNSSDTADRNRLLRARDLSQGLLSDIATTVVRRPPMAEVLASAQALHTAQVAQFAKAAKTSVISGTIASTTILTPQLLRAREHALASEFRALALEANRGDVAALLASAAAGIDQTLAVPTR